MVFDAPGTIPYTIELMRQRPSTFGVSSLPLASATGGAAGNVNVTHSFTGVAGAVVGPDDAFVFHFSAGGTISNSLCSVEVRYTTPAAP